MEKIFSKFVDVYLDAVENLRSRYIPYVPKCILETKVYTFRIIKTKKYTFKTILQLIPLKFVSGEDNNYIIYTVFVPTHYYFNDIIKMLENIADELNEVK